MFNRELDRTMALLLAFGVPAVSLFILTGSVTDPVNATKFLILGSVGMGALALVIFKGARLAWGTSKLAIIFSGSFVFFSALSVSQSKSPFIQNIYGVAGRNTGFLTYFFLVGILMGALVLRKAKSLDFIFIGLFITGIVNVLYCGWALFFGDFISWNNPYGNILGLFGNPNFIGAFLGIWISATVGYFLTRKLKIWQVVTLSAILILSIYEVQQTRAVQGVVVTAAGLVTVGFYWIRSRSRGWIPTSIYTLFVMILGSFALLGALQRGPLAEIVYKRSVSLRGVYWKTGIETGMDNPIFGAGMDAYGDWYRRSRTEYAALVMPGPQTVTNSAHNVVIDIFSYGGFPLLVSYLGILSLGAIAIIRQLRKSKNYDPLFVSLSVAWIGYQLQSIISINQIGLAVWGWVLTGALLAYDKVEDSPTTGYSSKANAKKVVQTRTNSNSVFSPQLVSGIGAVIGLILAAPPISGDMAWVRANKSGNVQEVEKALMPTYLHPSTSDRFGYAIEILHNSKLYELSHKYAQLATKFNPENFGAWFALYSVAESTKEEKLLAIQKMNELDPHNRDIPKA
jgi:O-antigen ligase